MPLPLQIQLFTATSSLAPHPSVEVNVPSGYKILGGGAQDNWTGAGNLLTASYPAGLTKWVAAGKDHEVSSPATLTAYAFALHDPTDEWDVVIRTATGQFSATGPVAVPHPSVQVTLTSDYALTGGGAFVHWTGAGNLLTVSAPAGTDDHNNWLWRAQSKDHDISDPATISAYIIGLKHRTPQIRVQSTTARLEGMMSSRPMARACLDPSWILTGGGADMWYDPIDGPGVLLTGSYPEGSCWIGLGKDHQQPSQSPISVWAIGIRPA
jgi:hypothetical protein